MEPEIVENYAKIMSPIIRKYIYLKENPNGQVVAREKGQIGVLEPVKLEHYVRFFSDFELKSVEDAVHVTCLNPYAIPYFTLTLYDQMLFEKKKHKLSQ
jgi:hypothetical protein